ncbi:MAG TPA: hypothetical protein VFH73_08615, partial [Polyangia bacterium]|nr:hypothetical protein [Polyangia bacterium]
MRNNEKTLSFFPQELDPLGAISSGARWSIQSWADGNMKYRPTRAVLACALLFAIGCDPGWNYHVPDPRPGAPQSSRDQEEIGLLISGGLSTGMLSVDIKVTNSTSVPLIVREDPFRVLDASHRPLAWYWGH